MEINVKVRGLVRGKKFQLLSPPSQGYLALSHESIHWNNSNGDALITDAAGSLRRRSLIIHWGKLLLPWIQFWKGVRSFFCFFAPSIREEEFRIANAYIPIKKLQSLVTRAYVGYEIHIVRWGEILWCPMNICLIAFVSNADTWQIQYGVQDSLILRN